MTLTATVGRVLTPMLALSTSGRQKRGAAALRNKHWSTQSGHYGRDHDHKPLDSGRFDYYLLRPVIRLIALDLSSCGHAGHRGAFRPMDVRISTCESEREEMATLQRPTSVHMPE